MWAPLGFTYAARWLVEAQGRVREVGALYVGPAVSRRGVCRAAAPRAKIEGGVGVVPA